MRFRKRIIKVCFKEEDGHAQKGYNCVETKRMIKVHAKGETGYSKESYNLIDGWKSVIY